jgi:very-long-chain enoyl-CoA reductase
VWQLDVNRQRITTVDKKVPLDTDEQLLTDLGVKSGDQLEIKDLGPQIGALYMLS